MLDPVPQQQSAPQMQKINQGDAQPTAKDHMPPPGSPAGFVNISTTPNFSVPSKFDKTLAPPREGCRAYLPEETPSGLDNRRNEFEAFRLGDELMRRDCHKALAPPREGCRSSQPEETPFGLDNRRNEFEAFRLEDELMRKDGRRASS
jgi:hypothetical protein